MKILYRADGGHPIGTGHIFRARRILAELARIVDLDAVLLTSAEPTAERIAAGAAARVALLPPRRDPEAVKPRLIADPVVEFAREWRPDVLVVDMLDTPGPDMAALRALGVPIVSFDDRGDGRFDADLLINVLVAEPDRARLLQRTALMEGPGYVVLDPVYAEANAALEPRTVDGSRRVFVATGGGDAAGLTVKVASALGRIGDLERVEFVCGPAFPFRADLDRVLAGAPWAHEVYTGLPNLIGRYAECDLAVVAGGLTMYEVCCVGAPALAVCQPIDHQLELADILSQEGAMQTVGYGLDASEDTIAGAVQALMDNVELRRAMSRRGPAMVDGRGTERVARAIAEMAT